MLMRSYFTLVMVSTGVARLVWLARFAGLSIAKRKPNERIWASLLADARLPRALQGKPELLRDRYDLYKVHQVSSYTLGGLALAAWTFLAGRNDPSDWEHFALAMITVAVLAGIGCPALFRVANGELTRMGYETGLAITGLALVVGMLSLGMDTFDGAGSIVAAVAIPAVLAVREFADVRCQIRLTRTNVFAPPTSEPTGQVSSRTDEASS